MATAMFQKLRLGSKAPQRARKDSVLPSSPLISSPSGPTLLGLPPELRNAIYEKLAADTTLVLSLAKRSKLKRSHVVGMLLVNKQAHREFFPVLLATARIEAHINLRTGFRSVIAAIEGRSQQELSNLAANQRIYLTLVVPGTPRPEELENIAIWFDYRALEGSHSHPATATASETKLTANSLRYRYDAKIDPSRSMAGTLNTKVVLLTATMRHIARLEGKKTEERQRMLLDLAEYKDILLGVERTDAERRAEIEAVARVDPDLFGVQYVPQYR